MSGGNRLYHIALGGWLLAASLYPLSAWTQEELLQPPEGQQPPIEETAEPEPPVKPAEDQDKKGGESPKPSEPLPKPESRVAEPVNTAPAEPETDAGDTKPEDELRDLAQRDLSAQQSMAESAWYMVVATWLATAITALGVALVWRTLFHTRRAAEYTGMAVTEAERATAEARRAADAAQEQLRSDRAWLGYSHPVFQSVGSKTNIAVRSGWEISLGFVNYGRSQAHNAHVFTEKILVPRGGIPEYPEFPVNDDRIGRYPVAPNQSTFGPPIYFKFEEFDDILSRRATWLIYALVVYEDMWGVHRQTETCLEVGVFVPIDVLRTDNFSPNSLRLIYYGDRNRAT